MSTEPPDRLERVAEILERALARRVQRGNGAEGGTPTKLPSPNATFLRAVGANVFGICWLILGLLVFLTGLIERGTNARDGYVMMALSFIPLLIGAWYVDRGLKAIRAQADAMDATSLSSGDEASPPP